MHLYFVPTPALVAPVASWRRRPVWFVRSVAAVGILCTIVVMGSAATTTSCDRCRRPRTTRRGRSRPLLPHPVHQLRRSQPPVDPPRRAESRLRRASVRRPSYLGGSFVCRSIRSVGEDSPLALALWSLDGDRGSVDC
ncbi:unnamed protein product [Ectocarpus sp. 12 AP-2014]